MQAIAIRRIVSYAVVAATLALAGVASWAITDYHVPALEAAASTPAKG